MPRPQFPLATSAPFWLDDLEGRGHSARTIEAYRQAAELFRKWAAEREVTTVSGVDGDLIRAWLLDMRRAGLGNGTRSQRFSAIRSFMQWTVAAGYRPDDPTIGIHHPVPRYTPPAVLTDNELNALIQATDGQRFKDVRDKAIILLLIDTGARRGEIAGIRGGFDHEGNLVGDLDLATRQVTITGKTGTRTVPFGTRTARALHRYLATRSEHRYAHRPQLWLGQAGALTPDAILQIVQRRARQAGVRAYTHLFRHTFAHSALANGMQEGDLQRLAGWSNRNMIMRYGASAASERATAAYRRLGAPSDRL